MADQKESVIYVERTTTRIRSGCVRLRMLASWDGETGGGRGG